MDKSNGGDDTVLDEAEYDHLFPILLSLEQNAVCQSLLPGRIMMKVCSFLENHDLANLACTNKPTRKVCYSACLWKSLNLEPYRHRVDDTLIRYLFKSSERFRNLKELLLDNCTLVTEKSLDLIALKCPSLERLSLIWCTNLGEKGLLNLLSKLRELKFIEIYGSNILKSTLIKMIVQYPALNIGVSAHTLSHSTGIVIEKRSLDDVSREESVSITTLIQIYKENDDYFDYSHAAKKSSMTNRFYNFSKPVCFFAERDQNMCINRVTGKIVFTDNHYTIPGNFPKKVIFTCQGHKIMIENEPFISKCEYCKFFFEIDAMFNDIICQRCFDYANFKKKINWIDSTTLMPGKLSIIELSRAFHIANLKNVPKCLRKIGNVNITLNMDDDNQPERNTATETRTNITETPFKKFWTINEDRLKTFTAEIFNMVHLDMFVNQSKSAVLAYDEDDSIAVFTAKSSVNECTHYFGQHTMRMYLDDFSSLMFPLMVFHIFLCVLNPLSSEFHSKIVRYFTEGTKFIVVVSMFFGVIVLSIVSLSVGFFSNDINILKRIYKIIATTIVMMIIGVCNMAFIYLVFMYANRPLNIVTALLLMTNMSAALAIMFWLRTNYYIDVTARGVFMCLMLSLVFDIKSGKFVVLSVCLLLELVLLFYSRDGRNILNIHVFHVGNTDLLSDTGSCLKYKDIYVQIYHYVVYALAFTWTTWITTSISILVAIAFYSIIVVSVFVMPIFGKRITPILPVLLFTIFIAPLMIYMQKMSDENLILTKLLYL